MNIALFGGTFDPVHRGHLAVARAAAEAFQLEQVHFVLADLPPHKLGQGIASYQDRFAMLEMAVVGEERFSASRIEERRSADRAEVNYSIDTVRRFKKNMSKDGRLFFIVGMDSFLDLPKWRDPVALLLECDFIVVSRPGHRLDEASSLLPSPTLQAKVHLLETVAVDVSSTQIREAVAEGRPLDEWVPAPVAQYIQQHGLYR